MERAPRFKARYKRQGQGWLASVRHGREDVTVFGRTLDRAREAAVAELAKRMGAYPGHIVMADDIELPPAVAAAVDEARTARARALSAAADAAERTAAAATSLYDDDFSLRDIAYVLGLSHSRIQQVLGQNKESNT